MHQMIFWIVDQMIFRICPKHVALFFSVFGQLEAFLTQRLREMGEEEDVVAMSQFQLAPAIIQSQSCKKIQEMLSEVQGLIGRLTTHQMQQLFMIQASPRYSDQNILPAYAHFSKCTELKHIRVV